MLSLCLIMATSHMTYIHFSESIVPQGTDMSTPLMGYPASKNDDPLKRSVERKTDLQDKIRSGEILRNMKSKQQSPQVLGERG